MRSKTARSGAAGDAPAPGGSQGGTPRQPRSSGETGRPCAVPARPLAGRPGQPRASHAMPAAARCRRGLSGWKTGALAPGVEPAAVLAEAGLSGPRSWVARRAGRLSRGPAEGPYPQPRRPACGVDGAASGRGTRGRAEAPPEHRGDARPGAGPRPDGHPQFLARPLCLLEGPCSAPAPEGTRTVFRGIPLARTACHRTPSGFRRPDPQWRRPGDGCRCHPAAYLLCSRTRS
jgi:hypothetical protein